MRGPVDRWVLTNVEGEKGSKEETIKFLFHLHIKKKKLSWPSKTLLNTLIVSGGAFTNSSHLTEDDLVI